MTFSVLAGLGLGSKAFPAQRLLGLFAHPEHEQKSLLLPGIAYTFQACPMSHTCGTLAPTKCAPSALSQCTSSMLCDF